MQFAAGACAKARTIKAVASGMPAASSCKVNHARQENEEEDDEQDAANAPQHAAEAAKLRGNVLYQQAQYPQAISLYSVSILTLLPMLVCLAHTLFRKRFIAHGNLNDFAH